MNKKTAQLLESLVEALRNLDDDAGFDMDIWTSKKLPESKDLHCGTSCCAIGLASTLPDWKEAGLELHERELFGYSSVFEPVFQGAHNFDAVAALLGISKLETQALFDPDFYSAPNDLEPWEVADRIECFIEESEE